ncbi:MAG TPA: hypothetical protein VNO43_11100 [Candidatus Eisenbacteria bacterium]|nr:hypothetical protein [Candidatus Eisenbacteria bacterium]
MARKAKGVSDQVNGATVGYEAQLWRLVATLREQQAEAAKLDAAIAANLKDLGYGD